MSVDRQEASRETFAFLFLCLGAEQQQGALQEEYLCECGKDAACTHQTVVYQSMEIVCVRRNFFQEERECNTQADVRWRLEAGVRRLDVRARNHKVTIPSCREGLCEGVETTCWSCGVRQEERAGKPWKGVRQNLRTCHICLVVWPRDHVSLLSNRGQIAAQSEAVRFLGLWQSVQVSCVCAHAHARLLGKAY